MIFIAALLMNAVTGVLTGLFGVGGGFLLTPLLTVVLGIPVPIAVGTGALQILGVSTAGLYRRRREREVDYKMAIVLFGGNYVGVQLGVRTLTWLGGLGQFTLPGGTVPAVDFVIMCVFVVLLAGIAAWLWYDTMRNKVEANECVGVFSDLAIGPCTNFHTLDRPRLSIVLMSYLGLIMGFLTGLLGVGGGIVMVPALIYLVGMRAHCAVATSLAMVWLTSFLATISHAAVGNVDLLLAVPLLVGGSVGVQIGVSLCTRLGGGELRRYFSLVVLAAMLLVAVKLVSMIW